MVITHAHIDHIGGLPVAEQRGIFADDAAILMTRPTNTLASILLHDSLQIRKQDAQEFNRPQELTINDVEQALDRVASIGYDRGHHLNVTYESGDAPHRVDSRHRPVGSEEYRSCFPFPRIEATGTIPWGE